MLLGITARMGTIRVVSSLAERVLLARTKRKLGVNDLDRLAELGKGYTSRIESGGRKKLAPETFVKIARALSVRYEWLTLGAGPMDLEAGTAIEMDDRYPNRTAAIRAWRALGREESAVDDLLADKLDADSDPDPDYWFGELETALRRSKARLKGKMIGVRGPNSGDDGGEIG